MPLTLGSVPGFTDIADALLDAGNALTAAIAKAIKGNSEYAAVRNEQFWGFYKHGETVQVPTSLEDGYVYSRAELRYSWSFYWSGGPPGSALNGTQVLPARGATGGDGTLLQFGALIDEATGDITTDVSYYKTAQTNTHDGILLVITHAQRDR